MERLKKAGIIIGLGALLAGLTAGSYFLYKKFLEDRQNVAGYTERMPSRSPLSQTPRSETRTYTAEELEKARKEGKMLGGAPYIPPQPPNANADAAIQRTLRTLEEINRINQMNQRLMEQQQRQNR